MPVNLPEAGILYVSPPLAHTRGTLRRLFWESGLPFGDPSDDVLAVETSPESLSYLCELRLGGLSETELGACKALLVDKGSVVNLRMLSRMQNLATLAATIQGDWLLDMLREERLAVHFQPIVPALDPGEVFAYECLLRGLDGKGGLVSPERMFGAAHRAGLLFNLDRTARSKAVEAASGAGLMHRLFINFNPAAIYPRTV